MMKNTGKDAFVKEQENLIKQEEEIANMNKKEAEENAASEEEKEKEINEKILNLIEEEHGITPDNIEEWKQSYFNKVFIVRLDDEQTFVFKYMTYPEWKTIMHEVSKSTAGEFEIQNILNEKIVKRCLLYPDLNQDFKIQYGAGTMEMLSNQIQLVSNFLPQDTAASLIRKI